MVIPASPARPAYPCRDLEMLPDESAGVNMALDSYIFGKRRLMHTAIMDTKAVIEIITHFPRHKILKISINSISSSRLFE